MCLVHLCHCYCCRSFVNADILSLFGPPCTCAYQVLGVMISVSYYIVRKKEIRRHAAVIMDDSNAQTMVNLTQNYSY